jgi:hypothetical protein
MAAARAGNRITVECANQLDSQESLEFSLQAGA